MQATQAAGDVLAEEWRSRVPVDEGNYRDSAIEAVAKPGKTRRDRARARREALSGVKRKDHPRRYAARLEFGSSGLDPGLEARWHLLRP